MHLQKRYYAFRILFPAGLPYIVIFQKGYIMVFSSLSFLLGFMPVFFLLYYILPDRFKNLCLLGGSLAFYAIGTEDTPLYFFLLVLSLTVNVWLGSKISDSAPSRRRIWLFSGLAYNFGGLFLFKYLGFFCHAVGDLLSLEFPEISLTLPPGISFFTFQTVSYLIDVSHEKKYNTHAFLNIATYLCMFPQLIAGPIITYDQVETQLEKRRHSLALFDNGLREFCIGLGLKVLLANRIGALWQNVQTIGFESISSPLAWMGIAAYSFQLYFDFYGYSLMAIGLGRMLGMHFPKNFLYPYTALSMTEFWRRWHVTLGQWFRDYVYIPLGGSREGLAHTLRNLLIVWLLTGIWHGAGWNYILWGLVLFCLLALEKMGLRQVLEGHPLFGRLYMLFAIPLTWLIFAVTDLNRIGVYLSRLFSFGSAASGLYAQDYIKYGKSFGPLLLVCFLFCTPLPRRLYKKYSHTLIVTLALLAVFWLSLYCLYIGLNDPFLYFQF